MNADADFVLRLVRQTERATGPFATFASIHAAVRLVQRRLGQALDFIEQTP